MRQLTYSTDSNGIRERVIKFIVNPVSGNGRTSKILPRLIAIAEKLGVHFDLQVTQAPQHATELADDPSDDFDVMVAVGGDGTVNEVAAGALKSKKTMAVIPTGTGNDFARALGRLANRVSSGKSLSDHLRGVMKGKVRSIDVGSVQMDNKEFLFVNGVGVGFDAEVARATQSIHRFQGISKYLLAVVKTLSKYKSSFMEIELDDRAIEQKTFLVAIGNGISSGGGFLLTPDAVLDDGFLDACIVSDVSVPTVLQVLPRVLNGSHVKHPKVLMARAKRIVIRSDTPVAIHRDGEVRLANVDGLSVRIMPDSLKITG
jgi:YegS/Rv2252/BmrU family lipid kinase